MGDMEIKALFPGWETVRKIGTGSFGTVYEIQRDVFGHKEKAALKMISIPQNDSEIDELISDGYDEKSITRRFQGFLQDVVREYSMMADMKGCTNIVYCDDVKYIQHDDGIGWDIFIKMELLTPLTKVLPETIGDEQVIKIGADICSALAYCEKRKVLHRDIKPQNIFVAPDGTYKLGDFGIAKTAEHTTSGTKAGTYRYMAPEINNNQPYGAKADLYSLGLVLYWLLNERRTPFLPLPPEVPTASDEDWAMRRRLSGEKIPVPVHGSGALTRVVLKACAYDPRDRYQSAEEMLAALERIGEPAQMYIPTATWRDEKTESTRILRSWQEETASLGGNRREKTEGQTVYLREAVKERTAASGTKQEKKPKPKAKSFAAITAILCLGVLLLASAVWFGVGSKRKAALLEAVKETKQEQVTPAAEKSAASDSVFTPTPESPIPDAAVEDESPVIITESVDTLDALNALLIGVKYYFGESVPDVSQWTDEMVCEAIGSKLLWDNDQYSDTSFLKDINAEYWVGSDAYWHFDLNAIQKLTKDTLGRDFPLEKQLDWVYVSGDELLLDLVMGESSTLAVQNYEKQGDKVRAVGIAVHNYSAYSEFQGYFQAVFQENPSSMYGYTLLSLNPIGENQSLNRLTAEASSVLKEPTITHYAKNAVDGNLRTAWVEGAEGVGINEWIKLTNSDGAAMEIAAIEFALGYRASEQILQKNGWPRKVLIECENGYQQTVDFYSNYIDTIVLDQPVTTSWVKITLLDAAAGTQYVDTCISEIRFYGIDSSAFFLS